MSLILALALMHEIALDRRGRVIVATWGEQFYRFSRRDGWRERATPCR